MSGRRSVTGAMLAALSLPLLSACQAPAAATPPPPRFVAYDGVGYIVFNAPIVARSREFLLADIEGLVVAGARTVRIAISSPGGDTDVARSIVDAMNRIHDTRGVTFETYGVGVVASAATYVFMAGQRRYARNGTGFLFHAAGMVSTGAVSAERLREAASHIDEYERLVRAQLKSRTRLTDAAIDIYLHRTVILNADDARRDGVVDDVRAFPAPNVGIPTIGIRPTNGPATPAAAPPAGPAEPPGGSR